MTAEEVLTKEQERVRRRKLYHRGYYLKNKEQIVRRTVVYNQEYNAKRRQRDRDHTEPQAEFTCSCCGRAITEANYDAAGKGPVCAAGLCQCQ